MITKTTMVVIFNLLNSHLSTLSSPTEEVFQVNGQNRLVANLPVIDFILSRKKCQHQSHRIRNFQFFFKYIGFLPLLGKFERRCLSAIRNFSVLAAIIQESADWPSGAKSEWHVSSWLAVSTHVKKYDIFSHVLLRLFLRAGNPCITPQFMW